MKQQHDTCVYLHIHLAGLFFVFLFARLCSVVFGPIRLILAGNVDIHTILNDFECPHDPITEYGDFTRHQVNISVQKLPQIST